MSRARNLRNFGGWKVFCLSLGLVLLVLFGSADAQESVQESTPIPLPIATPTPPATLPPRPTVPPTLNPDTISDQEITNLVQALQKIKPLVEGASRVLQATSEPAQRQRIEADFEAAATRVVQEHNLTPERYRDLITLANSNPVFRRRVQARLDALPTPSPTSQNPALNPALNPQEESP